MGTAMAAVCTLIATKIAAKITEDIYIWLKPLVLSKFECPKRYRALFILDYEWRTPHKAGFSNGIARWRSLNLNRDPSGWF